MSKSEAVQFWLWLELPGLHNTLHPKTEYEEYVVFEVPKWNSNEYAWYLLKGQNMARNVGVGPKTLGFCLTRLCYVGKSAHLLSSIAP